MQLTVVSYNIWDLPIWHLVKKRAERVEAIGDYLKTLNADIICLQESWDQNHQRWLHEKLGLDAYHITKSARGSWLNRFLGGAGGLVTFSKFPILSDRFVPFGFFNYSPVELAGRKGASEAVVQTPLGKLRVINTHLHQPKAWGASLRLNQLARVFDRIQQYANLPTVFAGDFNEHAILSKEKFFEFFNSRNFIHPTNGNDANIPSYRKENPLVDNWINRTKESKRIDYIFAKDLDKLSLQVKQNKPEHLSPELSDHDPVVLIAASENK